MDMLSMYNTVELTYGRIFNKEDSVQFLINYKSNNQRNACNATDDSSKSFLKHPRRFNFGQSRPVAIKKDATKSQPP